MLGRVVAKGFHTHVRRSNEMFLAHKKEHGRTLEPIDNKIALIVRVPSRCLQHYIFLCIFVLLFFSFVGWLSAFFTKNFFAFIFFFFSFPYLFFLFFIFNFLFLASKCLCVVLLFEYSNDMIHSLS